MADAFEQRIEHAQEKNLVADALLAPYQQPAIGSFTLPLRPAELDPTQPLSGAPARLVQGPAAAEFAADQRAHADVEFSLTETRLQFQCATIRSRRLGMAVQRLKRVAVQIPELGTLRRILDCPVDRIECLLRTPEIHQDNGSVGVGTGARRHQTDRPVLFTQGFVITAEQAQCIAAVIDRIGKLRLQGQRLVKTREGFLVAPESRQHQTADAIGRSDLRLQFNRAIETDQRFRQMAQQTQHVAAVAVRFGILRIGGDRTLVADQRFLETLGIRQQVAKLAMRLGMTGIEFNHPVVGQQRLFAMLQFVEHDGALELHVRDIRLQRHRTLEIRQRLCGFSAIAQRTGDIAAGVGEFRIQRQRALHFGDALGMAPHAAQRDTEIVVYRRIVGIEPQRVRQPRQGLRHVLALGFEHAEHVQHIEIFGLRRQHLDITFARGIQLTAALRLQRRLIDVPNLDRRRRGSRSAGLQRHRSRHRLGHGGIHDLHRLCRFRRFCRTGFGFAANGHDQRSGVRRDEISPRKEIGNASNIPLKIF